MTAAALPKRRLIPKWRSAKSTLALPESTSGRRIEIPAQLSESPDEFARAVSLWKESPTAGHLGEILSFAVDSKLAEQAIATVREAIANGDASTPIQRQFVEGFGRNSDASAVQVIPRSLEGGAFPHQHAIRRLRETLRTSYENPFVLVDLAQLHSALGKRRDAERAIRTAVSLAPRNRTLVRTLVRFLVHDGRPDEAHAVLKGHERTSSDPWLMAAEIAVADSAERASLHVAKARRLLTGNGGPVPDQITELAGAVAMEELRAGNLKKAREAQRRALLSPNDNVVAQAVEYEHEFGLALSTPQVESAIIQSNEAKLIRAWSRANPDEIEGHAIAWHHEEPFSSRPIQLLSSIYAFKGDLAKAEAWVRAGLLTDPSDSGLLINLAYVYALGGRLESAERVIRKLRHLVGATIEPYVTATEGLVAYSRGYFDAGDALYNASALEFERRKQFQVAAYSRANQALSALRLSHPRLESLVVTAGEVIKRHPSPDALMLLKAASMSDALGDEGYSPRKRQMRQWVFDPASNTLVERLGISAAGASPFVVLKR